SEEVFIEIGLTARVEIPRDALALEIVDEELALERLALEHAIVLVDLNNQLVFDAVPLSSQLAEEFGVDGDAVVFYASGRAHVSTAKKRARQIQSREHARQQIRQRFDVCLAVVKHGYPLSGSPVALHGEFPPGILFLL